MTSKGQVTIPKQIRDAMGLRGGDRISLQQAASGAVVMRPNKAPFERLIGILKRPGQRPISVEEMDEGIGAHMQKRFPSKLRPVL